MKRRQPLFWLFFFLSLVSGAILVTILLSWLAYFPLSHYWALAAQRDLTDERLWHNFNQLMRYLCLPWQSSLALTDFPISTNAYQHFVEVKHLFMLNLGVLVITLGPTVIWLRRLLQQKRQWHLVRPLQVAIVIPVVVAFLGSVNFNRFFVLFHEVLFRNLDWQFNPLIDPIILVLPEQYFMLCFVGFFILLEGSLAGFLWWGKASLAR